MHAKKSQNQQLLKNFNIIKAAAGQSYDGHRCMIAPSPELKQKLDEEMQRLKEQLGNTVLANKVKTGSNYKPVGLNDGLIYPGTMFPIGTSAELARGAAATRPPLTGTLRVIVVLVDFSDKAMATTKSHFEDLFFSLGVVPTGSVREYYREVTHNIIDIQGQVVGPYRMPETLAAYANNASGMGAALPNARTMAKDAAVASNAAVNYADYDNDGDGFVDAFIVVHGGTGGEVSGSTGDIWSHKWVLDGGAYTADGATSIYGYLTVPEDCRLGVCAHELGHLLFGFPDLYDTDYSSEGIGNWCLMASGSWNNGGLTPAHPSAWCKCGQNWVTTVNQVSNQTNVAIEDVKSGYKVYKLWKDGVPGSEYFLVENRQKVLFDQYLPNSGLLVWHIDEAAKSNTDDVHYKVALMQADGKKDMELNHNRGDAGDSFPGSSGNKIFSDSSDPNSQSYAGATTCVTISNISDSATIMQANISVTCDDNNLKPEHVTEAIKETESDKELKIKKNEIKEPENLEIMGRTSTRDKITGENKEAARKFTEGKSGEGAAPERPVGSVKNKAVNLESRIASLEAMLQQIQLFIDQSLKPDVSRDALLRKDQPKEDV